MSTFIQINTYPFTTEQLRAFRQEIEKSGSFDELMKEKEALKKENGVTFISLYDDINGYKAKYLCRVYEPLRDHYHTSVPYTFWTKLYEMLRKVNPKIK
jgi:hypothetical protein